MLSITFLLIYILFLSSHQDAATPHMAHCNLSVPEKLSESMERKSSIGSEAQEDPDVNERKVLHKIDFRVVPVLCLLYVLAFLDRCVPDDRTSGLLKRSPPQCQHWQCCSVRFEGRSASGWK